MTNPLPQSNVLAAIGSAVVVSVICTWTISTYFQEQIQREFDRVHSRLDAMTGAVESYSSASPQSATMSDLWASEPEEVPDAPPMPGEPQ